MPHVSLAREVVAIMGCAAGKPVPPPQGELVGVWATDDQAANMKTGFGAYRIKHGYIQGLQNGGSDDIAKIKINQSGWISYAKVTTTNYVSLIDMPVMGWADGTMAVKMGGSLTFKLEEDGKVLVVDGLKLYRKQ